MSELSPSGWRFVSSHEAEKEELPGKIHRWLNRPCLQPNTDLLLVQARLMPGEAHEFHHHPDMEEILYILSGEAEQWAEQVCRTMTAGDAFFVPAGVVHGTYNKGAEPLDFLAILSPAAGRNSPSTVEVSDQEPWKSLRR